MKIKKKITASVLTKFYPAWVAKHKVLSALISYNIILIVFGLVIICGFAPPSLKTKINTKIINPAMEKMNSAINYFKYHNRVGNKQKQINLNVSFKNYQKIAFKRYESMQNKEQYGMELLDKESGDWVPAEINTDEQSYNVKVRLKGRLFDHWDMKDMWSLNVRVKDGQTLFGMRDFGIQHPKVRDFLNEWLLHRMFKYAGLIYLRYEFIKVSINGKDPKLYAMEEGFDKRLIEHNQLREGPILKINGDHAWILSALMSHGLDYNNAEIEAYQQDKILADPVKKDQFIEAKNQLEAFRRGEILTSEAFDAKKLALLFAIIDLTGHHHATGPDNAKFYFNPDTLKLEMIGRDNQLIKPLLLDGIRGEKKYSGNRHLDKSWSWDNLMFQDPVFFKEYIHALEIVSQPEFLDKFFLEVKDDLEVNRMVMEINYPFYSPRVEESIDILYQNQKYMRDLLFKERAVLESYIQDVNGMKINALFFNSSHLPVEITHIRINDEIIKIPEILIQPFIDDYHQKYFPVEIDLTNYLAKKINAEDNIGFQYNILGGSHQFQLNAFPFDMLDDGFLNYISTRRKSNIQEFKFLELNEQEKKIVLKKGSWEIRKPLIIPAGYHFIVEDGVTLNLLEKSYVLSYSSVQFAGHQNNPIIIKSMDGSSQGVIVLNASELSTISFTSFEGLSNLNRQGQQLTGAVTFYESPVEISNSKFSNNKSEDALNIVRSEFSVTDSLFNDIQADAIDGDFVTGDIQRCSFIRIGNDAADFSGSKVTMSNIRVDGAGDKAVSSGEGSKVILKEINIIHAEIAVASKDQSIVEINHSQIESSRVGFTAYQKKSEFGPGIITAEYINLIDVEQPILVEHNSEISIDGKIFKSGSENMKSLFYGEKYGKSSR